MGEYQGGRTPLELVDEGAQTLVRRWMRDREGMIRKGTGHSGGSEERKMTTIIGRQLLSEM